MRLLHTKATEPPYGNFKITEFWDEFIPPYAILSHTWEEDEVTLQEMSGPNVQSKKGYKKIEKCCAMASEDGLDYAWVDTCCIDKTSSAELSEAINSMYSWYEKSEKCYAFLADVPSQKPFEKSRWFTRGWTLQELIAPSEVVFLDEKWTKIEFTPHLQKMIAEITGIPTGILSHEIMPDDFSVAQRMSWASKRKTSRIEDRAYSLMGLFDVYMPLLYGEKERSFIRLQEEIMRVSDDHTLFAWKSATSSSSDGLLATSPAAFADSHKVIRWNSINTLDTSFVATNRGVHLNVHFLGIGQMGLGLAVLNCKEADSNNRLIAIYVRDPLLTMQQLDRVWMGKLENIDLSKGYRPVSCPVRNICLRTHRKMRVEKRQLGQHDAINSEIIYPSDWLGSFMGNDDRGLLSEAAAEGQDDIVWLLLTRSDISPDLRKADHELTPLMRASKNGKESTIKLLLDRGANIDKTDLDGRSPLLFATANRHESSVRLLIDKGADLETKSRSGYNAILIAIYNQHEAMIKLLLDRGANIEGVKVNTRTYLPLVFAAQHGYESTVKLLLDRGANIEGVEREEQTSLAWAAQNGHESIVKLLLDRGANVEAKNTWNQTAITCAAEKGHESIVKLLLDKGADFEAENRLHQTPLLLAVSNTHGSIVKLLLDRGANYEAVDGNGNSPLSLARSGVDDSIAKLFSLKCSLQ